MSRLCTVVKLFDNMAMGWLTFLDEARKCANIFILGAFKCQPYLLKKNVGSSFMSDLLLSNKVYNGARSLTTSCEKNACFS